MCDETVVCLARSTVGRGQGAATWSTFPYILYLPSCNLVKIAKKPFQMLEFFTQFFGTNTFPYILYFAIKI